MKRKICLLLGLILLIGLLGGCRASDAPRTAEAFLNQLNGYMKQHNIPVSYSFGEQRDDGDTTWILCTPQNRKHGSEVVTEQVSLWLQYRGGLSDELLTVQVLMDTPWNDGDSAYHRMLSMAVSTLCDTAITEEMAAELYDLQVRTDQMEFHSVYRYDGWLNLVRSLEQKETGDSYYECLYRFCQPVDLTHSFQQRNLGGYGFDTIRYEVVFTEAKVNTDASLTVAELEEGINGFFVSEGLPLECAFGLNGLNGNEERRLVLNEYSDINGYNLSYVGDSEYYNWKLSFRFTSWDNPDVVYPTVDLTGVYGSTDEREFLEMMVHQEFRIILSVNAEGAGKDAPITDINIGLRHSTEQLGGTATCWDASWDEIGRRFAVAVADIWDSELGEHVVGDFMTDALAKEGDVQESATTDAYDLSYQTGSNSDYVRITYSAQSDWRLDRQPNTILDPQLLDCPITFKTPVIDGGTYHVKNDSGEQFTVSEGLFYSIDPYYGRYRYRTDIYGAAQTGDEVPELLKEYLLLTGSRLKYEPHRSGPYDVLTTYSGEYLGDSFGVIMVAEVSKADPPLSLVDVDYSARIGFDNEAYCVYYNENAECPVDVDYMIALAVGLSQICDEAMTVEEAIALHTHRQEVSATFDDWQISYVAPNQVAHIILKNTVTGMTVYYVMPKALFEASPECGNLETFYNGIVQVINVYIGA